MLRFGDIKTFLHDTPATSRFKCWFEIAIDLLLMGLFLIVLLSWTTIFYPESAGLVCVYLTIDNENMALSEGRYIASRCLLASGARFILFYPYFLFLQFILLAISHALWLRIPRVFSKLGFYHDLFTRIQDIQPKFDSSTTAMVPTIIPDQDSLEDVTLIYDKFIFLLTDKSAIKNVYIYKNIIISVLFLIFTSGNIIWIIRVFTYKVDFYCNLNDGVDERPFDQIVCNISPFYQLIGYFIFFQFLLLLVFILTLVSVWKLANMREYASQITDLLGAESERVSGLPGYNDFVLCTTVNNKNVKDGGFFIQMVKFVFKSHTFNEITKSDKINEEKLEKDRFQIEQRIIKEVSFKLGLINVPCLYDKDHLYTILETMKRKINTFEFTSLQNMKRLIFHELEMNPFYFTYLITGSLSTDLIEQKKAFHKYEKFVKRLKSGNMWPNNIVIAAASNVLNSKIFLIKAYSKNDEYIDRIDRFEPYSNVWNGKYFVISLIYPNYYNLFNPIDNMDSKTSLELYNFLHSKERRDKIIQMTREQVLRNISSHEVKTKTHKRKASYDLLNIGKPNDTCLDSVSMVSSNNNEMAVARARFLNSRTVSNPNDYSKYKSPSPNYDQPIVIYSKNI